MGYNENLERQCVKAYLEYITEADSQKNRNFSTEYKHTKKLMSKLASALPKFFKEVSQAQAKGDDWEPVNVLRKFNSIINMAIAFTENWQKIKYVDPSNLFKY